MLAFSFIKFYIDYRCSREVPMLALRYVNNCVTLTECWLVCSGYFWWSVLVNSSSHISTSSGVVGYASPWQCRWSIVATGVEASRPCAAVIAARTATCSTNVTAFTHDDKKSSHGVLHHSVFTAFFCVRTGRSIKGECSCCCCWHCSGWLQWINDGWRWRDITACWFVAFTVYSIYKF